MVLKLKFKSVYFLKTYTIINVKSEQKSKINTVCFNDISFSFGTSSGYELHKNQHIFKRYKINDAKLNYQKARNKKSNEQRKEFYRE